MSKMHKFTRPTSNQNNKKPGSRNFSKPGEYNMNPWNLNQFKTLLDKAEGKK
tara:strand:+ start:206 stop:361 length:156 start_codon:yes stop_codon:yes gene_type:complete